MPRKAFLKKKSLLDRFKDDYATHTGYIQSARAEHTWNNPLTRNKRTKELNRWIKSFAGKDHIHKLARFNAQQAGRNESYEDVKLDCLRYAGILELPNGVCVKVNTTIRCPRRAAFVFRITGIYNAEPENPSKYVIRGFYPVYGLERKPSEEFDIPCNDVSDIKQWIKSNEKGNHMQNEAMSLKGFIENLTEKLTKQFDLDLEEVQAYLNSHTQEMQELLDDKELSLKEKVLFVRSEITGKKDEGYGGTKSVMSIWGNRPRDVYPEVSYSSVNDMYNTLLKYGYGDKHPIYYKNNSPEQIKGHILGYFKWTPTNSDADIEADALAAATMIKNNFNKSESKEPADEKLGYEKGHKNSKGEDAPWVIRSHEDNRILASFAKKEDAEEHLQRMKQYSKTEMKSEAVNMGGFKNMLRTYNAKGGSVKNGPWRICDGAYDLWFELYYNETPILGCTENICKWYSNPETVGLTLDDYKKIEDAISSELFAIDFFKMPKSKQSEDTSKDEKMGENREDWVPCILVARSPIANNTDYCYNLDGDWTPHEDNAYIFKTVRSAEQTAQKFVDKLQRGHVGGFAAWTTKFTSVEPLKVSGSKSESLETYACFIDFKTEADAKQGMVIVKGWNPVRDDTAVVVDGLSEDAANRLWNDWKRKCAKAGLAISDEGEVYKEDPSNNYNGESKKSKASNLAGYTSDVISELDVVWGCGEDGATRIAKKYADVIQQNYVDGDLLASETAKFIAGQEHLTESRKKSESKKSEVHLELIETIIVPKWLWEAHVFGKEYGEDLDEHEQEILAKFEEEYGSKYTLDDRDEEADFYSRNDFDSYGGPCYEIDVYEES